MYLALLLSAAAFLISVFSLFYFRSYLKRRTGQERILSELREEVNNILKSIDETTDRDISLIEEREKNLKSLLADIEKRLRVYIREMDKRRDAEDAYAVLSKNQAGPVSSGSTSPAQSEGTYLELGKNRYRIGSNEPQKRGSGEEGTADQSSPAPSPQDDTEPAFPLPRFRVKQESAPLPQDPPPMGVQIRELLHAGFAAPVIASRLGISIAEVEFAAALMERREN